MMEKWDNQIGLELIFSTAKQVEKTFRIPLSLTNFYQELREFHLLVQKVSIA